MTALKTFCKLFLLDIYWFYLTFQSRYHGFRSKYFNFKIYYYDIKRLCVDFFKKKLFVEKNVLFWILLSPILIIWVFYSLLMALPLDAIQAKKRNLSLEELYRIRIKELKDETIKVQEDVIKLQLDTAALKANNMSEFGSMLPGATVHDYEEFLNKVHLRSFQFLLYKIRAKYLNNS